MSNSDKEDAEEIIHVTWLMKTSFALVMKFSWNFLDVNMGISRYVPRQKETICCIPHAQPLSLKWSTDGLTDTKENFLLLKRIEHWNRFVTGVELPLLFLAFWSGRIQVYLFLYFVKWILLGNNPAGYIFVGNLNKATDRKDHELMALRATLFCQVQRNRTA